VSTPVDRRGGAALGSPIGHSLSPVLHRAAYDALGLSDWSYRAIECVEADLGATLRTLDAEGLAGVGLTMPLKRAVLPMLAGVDDVASRTAAVNTVTFGAVEGQWHGANTDVPGMVEVLRAAGIVAPATEDGAVPWVLGAGATAGSALAALGTLGYTDIIIVARRPEATADLLAVAERVGVGIEVRPWAAGVGAVAAPVVIATTPAGATDELAGVVAGQGQAPAGLLFDVIYAPWPTALADAWSNAGGEVVGGLELLVEQAVEQVRLLTGQRPPAEALREAGYTALASR
jgi:shikimate 5-dehydrogenase